MDKDLNLMADSAASDYSKGWSQLDWDNHWMTKALALAVEAAQQGEVPVGAVVVCDNVLLGEGFNQPILTSDPTAHAEVVALRAAAKKLSNYRIPRATPARDRSRV